MTSSKPWILLVILLAVPAAAGALVPKEPASVAAWSDPARRVQASTTGPTLEITSERVASSTELPADVIRVRAAADAGRISQRLENSAGLGGVGAWLNMTLIAVTQFDDLDADGRYSIGDPVLKRFVISGLSRSAWNLERATDGSTVATVSYFMVEARSTVKVAISANAFPTTVGTQTIPPTLAVVNVSITNFPVQEGAARPRLALETRVAGQPMLAAGNVVQRTAGFVQYVSWADTATVGGLPVTPGVTVHGYGPPAANQAVVVFSYPMDAAIVHVLGIGLLKEAPRDLGAVLQEDVLGNWPLYLSGLAFAGMLIAVPVYRTRIRRGQR